MNAHAGTSSLQPFVVAPRKVKAGPPLNWISESVGLLRRNFGVLIAAYLFVMAVTVLVQLGVFALISDSGVFVITLSVIGALVVAIVLNAGLVAVFHGASEGYPRFADVFSGVSGRAVLHILLLLVGMVLSVAVLGVIGYGVTNLIGYSGSLASASQFGNMMDASEGARSAMLGMVVIAFGGVVLFAVFAALFFYAIPLVVISRQSVFSAIGNSFRASTKNLFVLMFFAVNAVFLSNLLFVPALIIGASSASIIGVSVVMMLASFVWGLILSGAYYLSFRDVLLSRTPQQESE
jgi:hypothetical protein